MGKTIQVYGFLGVVPAENVKAFFEKYTGQGTVYALEVKPPKNGGPRTYAKVQFTTNRSAEYIIALANTGLRYERSYLKARTTEPDIIQKPKAFIHLMECITLHFGCQVSRKKLAVLWKRTNVSVRFGYGMRNIYFLFSYDNTSYKLQLSYENIWQVEQYNPHGRTATCVVIQVSCILLLIMTFQMLFLLFPIINQMQCTLLFPSVA